MNVFQFFVQALHLRIPGEIASMFIETAGSPGWAVFATPLFRRHGLGGFHQGIGSTTRMTGGFHLSII